MGKILVDGLVVDEDDMYTVYPDDPAGTVLIRTMEHMVRQLLTECNTKKKLELGNFILSCYVEYSKEVRDLAVKIKGEPFVDFRGIGKEVAEVLINFVLRVAANENATPAELAALPGVAKIVYSWMIQQLTQERK